MRLKEALGWDHFPEMTPERREAFEASRARVEEEARRSMAKAPRNRPQVFDHTALAALFDGHQDAFLLWEEADRGQTPLVMPAVALAEANSLIGA